MKTKRISKRFISDLLKYLFVPAKDPVWVYLILGAITLIAIGIRLIGLNRPILYDEAFTFIHYASRSFKYMLASYSAPNNHIFHTILVGITYRLFGGHPWLLRLPAFVAGVLGILATYLVARRLGSAPQALAASAFTTVSAAFINYSTNGRGYTLILLFSLLLANFAILLVEKQSKSALILYGLTGALGFYTIPVFLYPMAGISLWVVANYLVEKGSWQNKLRKSGIFLGMCTAAGLLTLLLYVPVIFFGTGFESIVGNEVVKALSWLEFVDGVGTRISITWGNWMKGISRSEELLLASGFLVSVIFYWKVSRQKLPMQVFMALAIAILLVVQRVTPFGRVFLFLEAFYLMFAAAGLVWVVEILLQKVAGRTLTEALLSSVILLLLVGAFVGIWREERNVEVLADLDLQAEGHVANYIIEHITPDDTIVATAPVDIQTAYYLTLNGIPFDRFYKRDHPVEIKNALVLLRKNAKYGTPESVLDFYKLTPEMDMDAVKFLYEYAQVQVYSVPAK